MDKAACYLLLELTPVATLVEIKASYRRLARQYHPDTNPGDRTKNEKFIALTAAYQVLVEFWQQPLPEVAPAKPKITVTRPPSSSLPPISATEQKLKNDYYQQL